jgi:hypothetical protein
LEPEHEVDTIPQPTEPASGAYGEDR